MKLHLGCGDRYIPGFVHVDTRAAPHVDYVCDAAQLVLIRCESVGLVYASHILEHFPREQTPEVLREWRRVLAPGGVLRLAVPDFEALVRVYTERRDLKEVLGPLYGRGDHAFNHHRTIWDYTTLGQALEAAGFTDVRRWDWRGTEHAQVDDFSQSYIPHMDKERGTLISLNVEATRP